MTHPTFLCLLTTAAFNLCLGQTSAPAEPKKCCVDRQFTVTMGEVGGTVYPLTGNAVFLDGFTLWAYDFYRQRVGVETHRRQPNGTEKVSRTLVDYATKRRYVEENNVCYIIPVEEPMENPCLPNNATYLGPARFGYGSESLEVNTWEFQRTTKSGSMLIRRTFTKNGCVPVVEASYGMVNGASIDVAHFYVNFQPGLDDPSVLDLPSATELAMCNDLTGQKDTDIVG